MLTSGVRTDAGSWARPPWRRRSRCRTDGSCSTASRTRSAAARWFPPALSLMSSPSRVVGVPAEGPWKLDSARQSKLNQGELHLELALSRGPLAVTKNYVIYPRNECDPGVDDHQEHRRDAAAVGRAAVLERCREARSRAGDARFPLDDRRREPAGMLGPEDRAPGTRVTRAGSTPMTPSPPPLAVLRAATAWMPGSRSTRSRSGPASGWQHSGGPDDRAPFDLTDRRGQG